MHLRLAPGICLVVLALTAVLTYPLAAQSGPSQQSLPRGRGGSERFERTASISGRVLDDATSEGIEGARVELSLFSGAMLQEVYVDITGLFRFSDVRRGTYYVTVSHRDYEEKREMVQVMGGGQVGGLLFHLRPKQAAYAPVLLEPLDVGQHLIPKQAREEFERGAAEVRRNRLPEAMAHFDQALELYPNYVSAWHAKGVVHLQRGEVENARVCFEKAIEFNPNAQAPRVLLGGVYNAEHRYQEAQQHLALAAQLNPQSWLAHFELSRACWALNDLDGAEKHILRAHELKPKIPQIHLMRANVHLARQDYQGAIAALDDFLKLVSSGSFADSVRQRRTEIAERLAGASKP